MIVSPYEGIDFEDAIVSGKIKPERALSVLLEAIRPVLDSVEADGRTKVGLDAKPANFCVGRHSKKGERGVFIDFVPPRYRLENGVYLVDIPIPRTPTPMPTSFGNITRRRGSWRTSGEDVPNHSRSVEYLLSASAQVAQSKRKSWPPGLVSQAG